MPMSNPAFKQLPHQERATVSMTSIPPTPTFQHVERLHPCIRARRRFILRFLACCAVMTAVGACIFSYRCCPSDVWFWERILYVGLILLNASPAYLLALPARTKRATLLQLLGLVLPLLGALASCTLCWATASDDTMRLAYAMCTCVPGSVGMVYCGAPVFLLHLLLSYLEKKRGL